MKKTTSTFVFIQHQSEEFNPNEGRPDALAATFRTDNINTFFSTGRVLQKNQSPLGLQRPNTPISFNNDLQSQASYRNAIVPAPVAKPENTGCFACFKKR